MEKEKCPYLGLKNDPESVIDFPSPGNNCHHAIPTLPVSILHQKEYCLTEEHIRCPLFISGGNQPLPPNLVGRIEDSPIQKKYFLVAGIVGAIVFLLIVFLLINSNNKLPATASNVMTSTSTSEKPSSLENTAQTQFPIATDINEMITSTLENNQTLCKLPENWVVYEVKPTDSLVRIALVYHVTVEDLQVANCMGNRTLLKPGEEIFVPAATPTPTVSLTKTPTNTRTYSSPVLPVRTNTEKPQDPEPPRPTDPPPTQPPPTQPPPTQAPPTQPPPTQPPPTQPPPTSTLPPPPPPEP